MNIKVTDTLGNVLFEGDADDYLFLSNNDMEVELLLNKLEPRKIGVKLRYTLDYDTFIMEKLQNDEIYSWQK